jgi:hypothetical protein
MIGIFKDVFYLFARHLFANPSSCSGYGKRGQENGGQKMKSESSLQTLSHRDSLRDLGVLACRSKGTEEGRSQRSSEPIRKPLAALALAAVSDGFLTGSTHRNLLAPAKPAKPTNEPLKNEKGREIPA